MNTHIHTHTYICVYIHIFLHKCSYIHIYTYTHTHIYTCIHVFVTITRGVRRSAFRLTSCLTRLVCETSCFAIHTCLAFFCILHFFFCNLHFFGNLHLFAIYIFLNFFAKTLFTAMEFASKFLRKWSFFDQNQQPLNSVEPFERILRALITSQCPYKLSFLLDLKNAIKQVPTVFT